MLNGDFFILGIDLGTSAVKVVLIDPAGRELASASADFPTLSDLPGQAEQDPIAWLLATTRAVDELDARALRWRDKVAAIGLAGQMPTLVRLGSEGHVGRAITWKDARADDWAADHVSAALRRHLYERTGMPIDGRYLGPMLRYHFPVDDGNANGLLSAKDFLCFALTGRRVTDPSTAAGYGVYDLALEAFSPDLCAHWGLPEHWLPAVQSSHALAAPLSEDGAHSLGLTSGIPVTTGAADSVAGAYAMAGLRQGTVCIAMGSSTIILDSVPERRHDTAARYLLTPHVEPGWYGREMDLLATGTGHHWLSRLFNWQGPDLDRAAATSPPGAQGLTFTPYLAGGEQGALWNPSLRASLQGLTLQHAPADIARAFLEGAAFEMRRCIEVLAEAGKVDHIVISGAITDTPTSLQLLADIFARPVHPVQATSAAALGAALGALKLHTGSSPTATLESTAPQPTRPGPDSSDYEDLYASYLELSARS